MFTVLFEDTAAMLGLVVAFAGIALGEALEIPDLDAVASILIGGILAVTAALLAYESKGLLIGEGASPRVVTGVEKLLSEQPGIVRINQILTLHFGPQDGLLTLSLDVADGLSAGQVE